MGKVLSMKQHGDLIRFHISLRARRDSDEEKEHNIYNCVVVRFQIRLECPYYDKDRSISTEMRKHELLKGMSLRVGVTCKTLCINTTRYCSELWSDGITGDEYTNKRSVEVDIKIDIVNKYSIIQKKIHEDTTHTDFQLSADDGSVGVHKVYLAVHSDVFNTMLDGQWKETEQGRVELKGVTQKTLQYFKDFLYLGSLPDEDDGLCPLLLLATRYLVEDLRRGCMMRIMKTITAENLDSHIEFAVENQMHELKDNILEKIPDKIFASVYANKVNALMGKNETSSSSNE